MTIDVVIIGAGLSGLAIARTLQGQTGLTVMTLEKSRGPGGRLASKRIQEMRADIGAQFMTARDPRFQAVIDDALSVNAVAVWSPVMGKLTAHGLVHSPDQHIRYVGNPYMNAFARFLAEDIPIDTQQRVQSVTQVDAGWCITTQDTQLIARQVVLTAPVEQTRELLPETALHDMLYGFQSLPTWTAVVESSQPLLTDDGRVINAAFGDGQWLDFLSSEQSKPNRTSAFWVCHAAPAFSQTHLEADAAEVARQLCEMLKQHLKFQATPILAHRWRFARPADAARVAQKGAVQLAPGLWACSDGYAGGRCEGAYLSGLEVATRILEDL